VYKASKKDMQAITTEKKTSKKDMQAINTEKSTRQEQETSVENCGRRRGGVAAL
jgi:hypothetical protein